MTQNLLDKRSYNYTDEQGIRRNLKVTYSIVLKNGVVQNVFNEFNNSVERNSEVFEYFSNKFNN
jgi:hypothetical protein